MLSRPPSCSGCALDPQASGFAPPDGDPFAEILFLGEALGATEAAVGRPFLGDAGGMLQRILNLLGWTRESVRIANTISCFVSPRTGVLTEFGYQEIAKIAVGTRVLTHLGRFREVTAVHHKAARPRHFHVHLADGTDHHVTEQHGFYTAQGWRTVETLTGADQVMGLCEWCVQCGKAFHRSYKHRRNLAFCSVGCHNKWAAARGKDKLRAVMLAQYATGARDRFAITAAANAAFRLLVQTGWRPTCSDEARQIGRVRAAITRQAVGLRPVQYIGFGEAEVADLLQAAGYEATAQYALDGYNYDFRVGTTLIEVVNPVREGQHKVQERHGEKRKVAAAHGFTVVYVRSDTPQQVLDFLDNDEHNYQFEPVAIRFVRELVPYTQIWSLEVAEDQSHVVQGIAQHNCRPPNDWLDERAPYYHEAIHHCQVHRDPVLAEPHKVVVPLGAVALKTILGLHGHKKIRVQDFHGTITRDPSDRFWVVPSFHPSFLQRGAHNLLGTVIWDLQQAKAAAIQGKPPDPATLIVDPPLDWFTAWCDTVIAATTQDPTAYPISVDVETPDKAGGKDEGEITQEDKSYQILRVNLACHPDEGITVPFVGPYIDQLKRVLAQGVHWLWNKSYDTPRLIHAGVWREEDERRLVDLLWLWHFLQSDLPRGLGFVAPFYSNYGPWKHLADSDPAGYAAIDGFQTHRCGFGILGNLQKEGRYAQAIRHVHALHSLVLKPAQQIGVKIDRQALTVFKEKLGTSLVSSLDTLQQCYPQDLLPVTPEQGLTARPLENVLHVKASAFTRKGKQRKGKPSSEIKQDLYKRAIVIERIVLKEVLCCAACGETQVHKKHRCRVSYQKKDGTIGWKPSENPPQITIQVASVPRWYWQEPFNPDSWQQVLAYIKAKGHKPGKAKKTHKDSTNKEALEKLANQTKDPFYASLLDYRAVGKVKGTYVDGTERLLDEQDRVHPTPTFKPSTMRLSYNSPNITNVVADKGGSESLAAGFRHCVVATTSECVLAEFDFSGIEAVETGWFARDPKYIRLAKLGVHAGLASHILRRPYDLSWSDAQLASYFKEIKYGEPVVYDRAKRYVHGKNYGLTLHGMVLQFPQFFPNLKVAAQYDDIFRQMAPLVPAWQRNTQERASRQHYLGGSDHPFGYKHWFWSIFTYKKLTAGQYYALLQRWKKDGRKDDPPVTVMNGQYFRITQGEDSKRALAFYPQSTAAGVLKESLLRLFDPDSPSFIGDAYYGSTPLRAPIHDSMLLEVPRAQWDRVFEAVCREMLRPIAQQPMPVEWNLGPYLTIGIAAKSGTDWGHMHNITVPDLADLGVSYDSIWTPAEDEDEEDGWGLQRIVA